MMAVCPRDISSMAFCTIFSEMLSRLFVASSNINISGFRMMALATAMRWAAGQSLFEIFGDEDVTAVGDFVRNCRQLIDLLRQIRDLTPEPLPGVRAALRGVDRGVVAAEGAL